MYTTDPDRLSMLDDHGARTALIPAEVHGRYRRWRDRVYLVLLVIFLALPWIKINGLQAILIDVPNRRYEFFGTLLLAHDTPLLFFILFSVAMALAFATSVWGRVWCGWACPQTVFVEGVYRRIERWVQGTYIERRKLRDAPWTARKLGLTAAKWALFFVVSSLFAHSFIAYFAGSTRLLEMMRGSPAEHWTYFLLVTFVTALLMFDFGWFREQFCIIMCPYGRFQGVLMDPMTVNVLYDRARGEPRKGAVGPGEKQGDCVACNRCVQVCPTGIDIRKGMQLECVACTACIDACDEIMLKVKKPPGLIGYRAEVEPVPFYRRPRSMIYASLGTLAICGLVVSLWMHAPYSIALLRAKDTPFQEVSAGIIMNHFKAHLLNQGQADQEFELALSPETRAAGVELRTAAPLTPLAPGKTADVHFFLLVPKDKFDARGEFKAEIDVRERISGAIEKRQVRVAGPYSSSTGS